MARRVERYDRTEQVSASWGRWAARRMDRAFMESLSWSEYPLTRSHMNARITGDPDLDYLTWVAREYFQVPVDLGLSIGCGSGAFERRMLELGYARAMEGIDVSEQALAIARREAKGLPVSYSRMDLNNAVLEPARYDFVISIAALHHVTNLERCIVQVHRSLKPDGLFIMWEFIGPNRFQWTDDQLFYVNWVYESLPDRYKYNHMTGMVHPSIERRPLEYMLRADPSEAVRSAEIMGIVTTFFEPLSVSEAGGALLHPLLEGIAGNFDRESPRDVAMIEYVVSMEDYLMDKGILPSDFVMMVARRRARVAREVEMQDTGARKLDVITRQESEILTLNRRLEDAERQTQMLVRLAESRLGEIGLLRADREAIIRENEALKSQGPFRTLRFLRAKLRGGSPDAPAEPDTASNPTG